MSAIPSGIHRSFLALLAFLTVLIVGYASDLLLARHPTWSFADDFLLGLAAAAIVYHYEKERSRFLAEKLRIIRDMNAFVRNELQILYATMEDPGKNRVPIIERSVARIDWALRELLPGSRALRDPSIDEIKQRSKSRVEKSA